MAWPRKCEGSSGGNASRSRATSLGDKVCGNGASLQCAGDAITGVVSGPASAAISFIKDFAFKIVAFILLGVIGVWLVSQGASKAFGTPTVGQVAKSAPVPIPV